MAAAGLCFLAVIETGARAAMLSMLIVSGFIALFLCLTISKSRRLIVILGVTIILVLRGYLTTRPSLLNDLLAIANTRAFDDRIPPWTAAISMIESAPFSDMGSAVFPNSTASM